jgi:hypothetical protein
MSTHKCHLLLYFCLTWTLPHNTRMFNSPRVSNELSVTLSAPQETQHGRCFHYLRLVEAQRSEQKKCGTTGFLRCAVVGSNPNTYDRSIRVIIYFLIVTVYVYMHSACPFKHIPSLGSWNYPLSFSLASGVSGSYYG